MRTIPELAQLASCVRAGPHPDSALSMLPTFLVVARGKGLAELLPRFDRALARLRQTGRYQAIYDRYR